MPLAPPSPATVAPVTRQADTAAAANWRANVAALTVSQPSVVERIERAQARVSWIYGRDGALTAQDAAGAWWAGCSVPAAAAAAMLRSMGAAGNVACFLRPPSAASVRVALDKLRPNQAIVALVPDLDVVSVMLHCDDFAADIRDHRLWLAIGDDWESELTHLFAEGEGLPTPSQFIRLTDGHEELAEAMIAPAQRIFSELTHNRATLIADLQCGVKSTAATSRACVVAATHFRLWDDAGYELSQLAAKLGWSHLDPDDPACASPLAMARAAAGCAAVIMPNTSRADLPNVIPPTTPWVTWLTGPRVPTFNACGPRDALLLADPAWQKLAMEAGWPASRVHVAAWPELESSAGATKGPLTILADLPPREAPKDIADMSSHRLLWDAIADELVRDPFALGGAILDYLHARMKRLAIDPAQLDLRRFIDDLVAPAYARGLAEVLHRNGLPLRLAGEGWDTNGSPKSFATGPVTTRESFREVIASAAALVHVWPTAVAHPIDHMGKSVVRANHGRNAFLRDARAAAGKLAEPKAAHLALSPELLNRVLATL